MCPWRGRKALSNLFVSVDFGLAVTEHLHRKEKQPPPPTIAGNEKGEVVEETISVSKEAEECEGKEKASAPTRVDEDSDKEKEKDKKENGELESVMNLFSQKVTCEAQGFFIEWQIIHATKLNLKRFHHHHHHHLHRHICFC